MYEDYDLGRDKTNDTKSETKFPLLGKWRYVETSKAHGYTWTPGPPNLFRHLTVYEIFHALLVEG